MKLIIKQRNDVWLDNGILEMAEMINNIKLYDDNCIDYEMNTDRLSINIKDSTKFIDYLCREIQNQLKSNIFVLVDDDNGGEKNVIKDHVLLQYGSKVDGVNTVGERLFSPKESRDMVEAFVNQQIIDKKAQVCVLCGEKYNPSVSSKLKVNILKQAVHPLATKNSAISHIRTEITNEGIEKGSSTPNFSNVCLNCYMLGVMQYANSGTIYYTDTSQKKSYMFMPYINDLKEAFDFRNSYINAVLTSTRRYSNLKFPEGSAVNFKGKYSLFLLFLEKVADIDENDKTGMDDMDIFQLLNAKAEIKKFKDWYQIEANTGKLKNPCANTVRILDSVYELIFDEGIKPYLEVIKNIWFQGEYDESVIRKEKMSDSFINDDFHEFALAFKPYKGNGIIVKGDAFPKLDNLIFYWRWKQVGLSQETQKTIKAVGRIIAATSEYRKSLIYMLEKVRTKTDLLNVLAAAIKGYYAVSDKLSNDEKKYLNPMSVNELADVLNDENLDKRQLEVIKDTLMINSFVSLIRNTKSDKEE